MNLAKFKVQFKKKKKNDNNKKSKKNNNNNNNKNPIKFDIYINNLLIILSQFQFNNCYIVNFEDFNKKLSIKSNLNNSIKLFITFINKLETYFIL